MLDSHWYKAKARERAFSHVFHGFKTGEENLLLATLALHIERRGGARAVLEAAGLHHVSVYPGYDAMETRELVGTLLGLGITLRAAMHEAVAVDTLALPTVSADAIRVARAYDRQSAVQRLVRRIRRVLQRGKRGPGLVWRGRGGVAR